MSLELQDQYDKIYKYCYFKVKNPQLAEDLTQETFLKFFSQNTYISRGKPLAYLYTIAKNVCVDTFRKKEPVLLESLAEETAADDWDTPIALKQAVSALSSDLQEIILLRFANELSVLEISKILGLSRFAVHRKINNALTQLKSRMRKEDF